MFTTLVSNITATFFLSVKKHSAENVVKKCLNSFPETVSLKPSFLMLFKYLCEIMLLLLVFDHNLGYSKLENFFQSYTTRNNNILCQDSYRNEGTLHHDFSNFYNIFLNATLNRSLFGFEFHSIL